MCVSVIRRSAYFYSTNVNAHTVMITTVRAYLASKGLEKFESILTNTEDGGKIHVCTDVPVPDKLGGIFNEDGWDMSVHEVGGNNGTTTATRAIIWLWCKDDDGQQFATWPAENARHDTEVCMQNIPMLNLTKCSTNSSVALYPDDVPMVAGVAVVMSNGTIVPVDIWIYNSICMAQTLPCARTIMLQQMLTEEDTATTGSSSSSRSQQQRTQLVVAKNNSDMKNMHCNVVVCKNGFPVMVDRNDSNVVTYADGDVKIKLRNVAFALGESLPDDVVPVTLTQTYGCVFARRVVKRKRKTSEGAGAAAAAGGKRSKKSGAGDTADGVVAAETTCTNMVKRKVRGRRKKSTSSEDQTLPTTTEATTQAVAAQAAVTPLEAEDVEQIVDKIVEQCVDQCVTPPPHDAASSENGGEDEKEVSEFFNNVEEVQASNEEMLKQELARNLTQSGVNEHVRRALNSITEYPWFREQTLPDFRNKYLSKHALYRADVYCKEMNTMVEYNGTYHYQRKYYDRTTNDILKRRFCKHNGIVQINVNPVVPRGSSNMQSYLTFRLYTEVPCYSAQLERRIAEGNADAAIAKCRMFALFRNSNGVVVDALTIDTTKSTTASSKRGGGKVAAGSDEESSINMEEVMGPFSRAECEYLEHLVTTKCIPLFAGTGRYARFNPLFRYASNVAVGDNGQATAAPAPPQPPECGDYAAYSLKYDQTQVSVIDTRSMMELQPAGSNNVIYIVFWKRFPRIKYLFYRTDVIHVPLFLLKSPGLVVGKKRQFPLVEYLACRIFDQVDVAAMHWKTSRDPSSDCEPTLRYYRK